MKDFAELLQYIYAKDLSDKKTWYSSVAEAYDKNRPRYPQGLIHRVVEIAQLPASATILELGCGPGIATVEFAKLGFSVICLEPSREACELARQNCSQYKNVQIHNITFEEWEQQGEKFDAVLAASSFHWVSGEIRCMKSADVLKDNGSLVLLWNKEPQPNYEIYQHLSKVYQQIAPQLVRYEDRVMQEKVIREFGESIIDPSYFTDIVYGQQFCSVDYTIDDYLGLLSTLSPYIALETEYRNRLFSGLREVLLTQCGDRLHTYHLSAFHIARKK
ncbi:MAG: methyltransferase domain-containing protein [Cyanobacteria bacterium P01_A01_bin.45]